jgi:hypothetical protein
VRKTVFWAAGFALALAIGGCAPLQKSTDAADECGCWAEYTDDTGVLVFFSAYATYGETTTTRLELHFSQTVAGLTAENIYLQDYDGTGIQKGALTGSDTYSYTLAVSGINKAGWVTVAAPAGYIFAQGQDTRMVRVVYGTE